MTALLGRLFPTLFAPHPGGLPLSRDEHEAIHRKLDLILEGQQTIMSQQSDLHDALAAISGDVDTLKQHATDLEGQLAAKATDLNVDLSAEVTLAQTIRAKLEGVSSAMPAPADAAAGAPADAPGDAPQA